VKEGLSETELNSSAKKGRTENNKSAPWGGGLMMRWLSWGRTYQSHGALLVGSRRGQGGVAGRQMVIRAKKPRWGGLSNKAILDMGKQCCLKRRRSFLPV